MGLYPVPELRLPLSLGSYYSPGYFGVLSGSRNVASSHYRVAAVVVSPCPFWAKPIAYVGLSSVTTNHRKFDRYPCSTVLGGIPD